MRDELMLALDAQIREALGESLEDRLHARLEPLVDAAAAALRTELDEVIRRAVSDAMSRLTAELRAAAATRL
jgi:hypothetical protein